MTTWGEHDPLCHKGKNGEHWDMSCSCSYIQRIREDERKQLASKAGVSLAREPRPTSKNAAMGVLPRSGSRELAIYEFIDFQGDQGATDWEIEQRFGLPHQSASSARNRLMNKGLVADSGRERHTGTGNRAVVWVTHVPLTDAQPSGTSNTDDPELRASEIDDLCEPTTGTSPDSIALPDDCGVCYSCGKGVVTLIVTTIGVDGPYWYSCRCGYRGLLGHDYENVGPPLSDKK